jgi:hypothetical protein
MSVDEMIQVTASWDDVMSKAKRLILGGGVALHRNGVHNIAATVQGDHGTYQTEIGRDDPNTRVITTWNCSCPWSQFAWDRTRQWKQYEGRTCSHTLAAFWKALATPLDEDATEEQRMAPGVKQGPAGWGLGPAPTPDTSVRTFDPNQPTIQDTLQDPDTVPEQPQGLDQELLQLQQQDPNQFQFQSPTEQSLRSQFPNLFESRVAAGDDLDRIQEMLYPSMPGTKRVEPTVQIVNQNGVDGELRGGKIPVPGANPVGQAAEGFPVFRWQDLGFDPQTGAQANPLANGPEERGRRGQIPMGARATAVDVDPNTRQVCIMYFTDSYKLHHHLIKTWVDAKDVRIASARVPPYRQRRR